MGKLRTKRFNIIDLWNAVCINLSGSLSCRQVNLLFSPGLPLFVVQVKTAIMTWFIWKRTYCLHSLAGFHILKFYTKFWILLKHFAKFQYQISIIHKCHCQCQNSFFGIFNIKFNKIWANFDPRSWLWLTQMQIRTM